MTHLTLRPDFKTSGGESSDILWKDRYVGSLTLLFREQDRIAGAVQLEKESLSLSDKEEVVELVRDHIQSLIHAVQARECDILVTYSSYDHVISTPMLEEDLDTDVDWTTDDDSYGDFDPGDNDSIEMSGLESRKEWRQVPADGGKPVVYELVVVDERRNGIDYHIYDNKKNWIAEADLTWKGAHITGDIDWVNEPTEEDIEHITDLVVSDFDENEADTFVLHHRFEGDVVETIELTHEDLLEEGSDLYRESVPGNEDDDYHVVLVRDDGDMLTYEIYKQSLGGLPIGTATIDISRRELTGYIDFREREGAEESESIAQMLMQELDKEKDYEVFSLTMLYKNEPIDEIVFTTDTYH